jgi:hypothetical protein
MKLLLYYVLGWVGQLERIAITGKKTDRNEQ